MSFASPQALVNAVVGAPAPAPSARTSEAQDRVAAFRRYIEQREARARVRGTSTLGRLGLTFVGGCWFSRRGAGAGVKGGFRPSNTRVGDKGWTSGVRYIEQRPI